MFFLLNSLYNCLLDQLFTTSTVPCTPRTHTRDPFLVCSSNMFFGWGKSLNIIHKYNKRVGLEIPNIIIKNCYKIT